jgi:hypothetical protein
VQRSLRRGRGRRARAAGGRLVGAQPCQNAPAPSFAALLLPFGARPEAPRALISSESQGSLQQALPAAAADPCASVAPLVAAGSAAARPTAPAFEYAPAAAGATLLEVPVGLDVLAFAPAAAPAASLGPSHLGPALCAQLAAAQSALAARAVAGQPLAPLRARHFQPPGWGLPLTLVYPRAEADADASEAALLPTRQALHALLGLPPDVPMLRVANALTWGEGGGSGGDGGARSAARLKDVHQGLAPPGGCRAGLGGPGRTPKDTPAPARPLQGRRRMQGAAPPAPPRAGRAPGARPL